MPEAQEWCEGWRRARVEAVAGDKVRSKVRSRHWAATLAPVLPPQSPTAPQGHMIEQQSGWAMLSM